MKKVTELVVDRNKAIPFTYEGRALEVRPMPLRIGMMLNSPNKDGEVSVGFDAMAECLSQCVLFADTGENVFSTEDVLNGDSDFMIALFNEMSLHADKDSVKN